MTTDEAIAKLQALADGDRVERPTLDAITTLLGVVREHDATAKAWAERMRITDDQLKRCGQDRSLWAARALRLGYTPGK